MCLLVDTDAFCKLGLAGLLNDAAGLFTAQLRECGRLPALPYMLRRGSLPRSYGEAACRALVPLAVGMTAVSATSGPWLERLSPIPDIDPGEAILFSTAAETGLPIITGDLRALGAVKSVDGFSDALAGRVVVPEALLLGLCSPLSLDSLRASLEPLRGKDRMLDVCFSPENRDPKKALRSYLRARRSELAPLVLWDPPKGESE